MRLKTWLLLVVLLIGAAACRNKDAVNPDAGARIAGTYAVSRLAITGTGTDNIDVTLPRTGTLNGTTVTQSGQVVVTRSTENTATMNLVLKTTGQADSSEDLGTVEIRGNELYQDNARLGTADGTNLNIDYSEGGVRVIIVARK